MDHPVFIALLLLSEWGCFLEAKPWGEPPPMAATILPSTLEMCRFRTDHYWDENSKMCQPCSRCHSLGLITLRGCAPHKDAVCGTMNDFKKQQRKQRNKWQKKNGRDEPYRITLRENDGPDDQDGDQGDAVYGRAEYEVSAENSQRRSQLGPTHKIKLTVRNSSQKKKEFFRQLQETENITDEEADEHYQDQQDPLGNLEGQVRFSSSDEDRKPLRSFRGNLHDDIRMIEQQLLIDNLDSPEIANRTTFGRKKFASADVQTLFISASTSTTSTTATTTTSTTTTASSVGSTSTSTTFTTTSTSVSTTTLPRPTSTFSSSLSSPPPLPPVSTAAGSWPDAEQHSPDEDEEEEEDEDDEDESGKWVAESTSKELVPTSGSISSSLSDRKRFIPAIENSFAHLYGDDESSPDEVFGAIVRKPSSDEDLKTPDEFSLLSTLLQKHSDKSKKGLDNSEDVNSENDGTLHLRHILILVGFLIGFSFVLLVGIVYTKVIRIGRFRLIDNQGTPTSMGEASLLSSRNDSIQESRISNSPQLSSRTVVAAALDADLPTSSSPTRCGQPVVSHQSYVDHAGRTLLKPSRELPV